jgi:hypothetical protein
LIGGDGGNNANIAVSNNTMTTIAGETNTDSMGIVGSSGPEVVATSKELGKLSQELGSGLGMGIEH